MFLQSEQGFGGGKDYSDDTAAMVDAETKKILEDRSQHVTTLLTSHKEKLIAIAERLLEKEVIFEDEFMSMVSVEPAAA